MMSAERFRSYKAGVEDIVEARERLTLRLTLRNKVKSEKHLRDTRGVKQRDRNENVFARPDGLRENAEAVIFVYHR